MFSMLVNREAQRQSLEGTTLPAPVGGIDGRSPLAVGDPNLCIYTHNLMPSEQGMLVRKGSREWVDTITNGSGTGGNTVIPFEGGKTDGTDDALFVVNNEGIWDVTAFDTAPTLKFTFADQTDAAGWGVWTNYTTDAGAELIFYADSKNGLFTYTVLTSVWAQTTSFTGPTITNISFIMVHKQRIWLIEEDAGKAWYLAPGAISGLATEFFLEGKFKHGGDVAGIFNWSVDGGIGVDDYLVILSRGGDVIPYQGSDPSASDWHTVGTYYVGSLPKGRRHGSEYGGDLYFISSQGIISMADLLKGADAKDISANSLSFKITRIIRDLMVTYIDEDGWELKFLGNEGQLVVTTPRRDDTTYFQYVLNLATQGWGIWTGLPIRAIDNWQGGLYFVDVDDRILILDSTKDEVPLSGSGGNPIPWTILSSYQDFSTPGLFKNGLLIRPDFLAAAPPSFTCRLIYDYSLTAIFGALTSTPSAAGVWDTGLWDTAIWGSGESEGFSRIIGGSGIGRRMAVAMKGESKEVTRLMSWDVMWRTGGVL